MSKLKVQEVTKELSLSAGRLLDEVSRIGRSANETLASLRRIEQRFVHAEEEQREAERKEQQRLMLEQQRTAWIMPEEEPEIVMESEPDPAPAPVIAVHEAMESPVPQMEEMEKEEKAKSPAEEDKDSKAKKDSQPAINREAQPAKVVTRSQPVKQQPVQARPPQTVSRPAQTPVQGMQPARPVPPSGGYGRPAPAGTYGRPANPQYGRPAPGAGPYGRPANSQNAGAPPVGGHSANPQYGRPAPGAGPYGRPSNQQFGRPAQAGPGSFNRPQQQGARPPFGSNAAPRPGGFGGGRVKGLELAPPVEKERVSNYDPNKKLYQRQYDPERTRSKKGGVRELGIAPGDDEFRGSGRKRRKTTSAQQSMAPIRIEKAYMTAETITVKDLTERIGKPAGDIIKKLLLLGIMATINQELDYETASVVAAEFAVELELKLEKTAEDKLTEGNFEDVEEDLSYRPPVVTIMGHVDHGKTSLLDYIRKSRVTEGEAGGITQHIGAYMVPVNDQTITFLDTPGHEAFTAMRARGAQATDIAILVVAADDGVMPQTVEAINHAKASKVPIIIAINKMDKEGADPTRVKQELTAHELIAEDWGGETIMVPISAITGEGVDQLLEMVLLVADMLQLRANPNRRASGIIIEAKLDKGRGPVATILVQNGTLHVGDTIIAGMAQGRIRAMVNERGERMKEAPPSAPVEVIGFSEVPDAGDEMHVVDERLSRQVIEERRDKQRVALVKSSAKVSLDDLFTKISEGEIKDLNIIVKADVQGSVEAMRQSLERLSNDEVRVRIIHGGVGAITENDVMLAMTAGAIIIGFNVRPENNVRDMAAKEEVDVRLYRIIYQAIEDVEKAMKGLLAPQYREVILGHAQVRRIFRITNVGTVAGCYVTDGKMQRNATVRLLRDNVTVFEGNLDSLKRVKDDAREIATGFECGIGLEKFNDIHEGDVIECFITERVER